MNVERKFKAIKIGLMRSDQFGLLRGVAMHGKTILTTSVPTAATGTVGSIQTFCSIRLPTETRALPMSWCTSGCTRRVCTLLPTKSERTTRYGY